MNLQALFFYVPATVLVMFSLSAIFVRNPIYAVLSLGVTFLAAAIIMFGLNLQFVPLILIVIYVGAVVVLFLFIVMMVDYRLLLKNRDKVWHNRFAVPTILLFFGITAYFIYMSRVSYNFGEVSVAEDVRQIASIMYNDLNEELINIALLLLVGVVGAVILTKEFIHYPIKRVPVNEQLARSRSDSVVVVSVKSGEGVDY